METYETPEVVTFGELDFEPTQPIDGDGTIIVCGLSVGNCNTRVILD